MKIWVYSICWNEKILLPFYLRHYASFADKIIVYDHHSDDGSRLILASHSRVEMRNYDAVGIHEPSINAIYNNCYKEAIGKADWVILCDIDEFIYDPDILATLQEYKDSGITVPKTLGYTMLHDNLPVYNGKQIYYSYKLGVEDYVFNKSAIINPRVEITYDPGRHSAKFNPEPIYSQPRIKLLHYRYWGMDWLLERNRSHCARLSQQNIDSGWGYHIMPDKDNGAYYTPKWFAEQVKIRKEVV